MKHLPLKLGIFVVLLFSVVIATCLVWMPVKVRYDTAKLKSNDPKERVAGVDGLLSIGVKGVNALKGALECSQEEVNFIKDYWKYHNTPFTKSKSAELSMHKRIGSSPLHIAAEMNYLCAARLFIDKKVDVNAKSRGNIAPIHFAADAGHIAFVELLLENGADVNSKGENTATPLHAAAYRGNKALAALLIKQGANVNSKAAIKGSTPLHYAVRKGHTDIILLLLGNGANVNRTATNGETPLHVAVRYGHWEIVKLLVGKGADVNAVSVVNRTVNRTPLDEARYLEKRNPLGIELQMFLVSHGAKTAEELEKEQEKK